MGTGRSEEETGSGGDTRRSVTGEEIDEELSCWILDRMDRF